MKKVFTWYNQLLENDMLDFTEEEVEEKAEVENEVKVENEVEKKIDADNTDKKS